ncbi:MAG: hypothetical protein PHW79_10725 [Candidatus Marinimicrobia bacterium]|nr:hypothetical protein [Candidatus Neomarinimicrobiota bacterium]
MATLYTEIISNIAGSKSARFAAIVSAKAVPTSYFDNNNLSPIFRNPEVSAWEDLTTNTLIIQTAKSGDPVVWRESVWACVRLGVKEILFVGSGISTEDKTSFNGCIVINHVNVSGENPLIGPNDDSFGPRFPDMSNLYPSLIMANLKNCSLGAKLTEGCLLVCYGENAETALEKRIAGRPEIKVISRDVAFGAIAAKHAGIPSAAVVFYPKINPEIVIGLIREFFLKKR